MIFNLQIISLTKKELNQNLKEPEIDETFLVKVVKVEVVHLARQVALILDLHLRPKELTFLSPLRGTRLQCPGTAC